MTLETLPDIEGSLRTWLRAQTAISSLVSNRVFFGIPTPSVAYPLITLSRVAGGDDPGEAPVDEAVIQFHVWGLPQKQNGKATALAVVNALRSVLRSIRGDTVLVSGVRCYGVVVDLVLFQPDPVTDRARYVVTARVTSAVV